MKQVSAYILFSKHFSCTDRLSNVCNPECHSLNKEKDDQSKLTSCIPDIHIQSLLFPLLLSVPLLLLFSLRVITIEHFMTYMFGINKL